MLPENCSLAPEQTMGDGHGGKVMLLPLSYLCWGTAAGGLSCLLPGQSVLGVVSELKKTQQTKQRFLFFVVPFFALQP